MRIDDILLGDPHPDLEPWASAASRALDALRERGLAMVPGASGVDWRDIARWLHRAALAAAPGRWWPCVFFDAAHAGDLDDAWWGAAHGGWVCTDAAADALPDGLARAMDEGRLSVLSVHGATIELPGEARDALARARAWHAVAVDPALEHARVDLLARCASASPVHLYGEWGAGKRALVMWAHARAGHGHLGVVEGANAASSDGWTVWPELGGLGEPALAGLRDALRAHEPTRGVFSARVGARGTRPDAPALAPLVGESRALVDALALIARVAPADLSVLLRGEPGTGKELAARAIHELSGRPGPFVALDMGALGEGLAESTLFGHKRGAFTGAQDARQGALRAAHGGTLLLDEIGNLSVDLQVKLLRVLQERAVTPVGEDQPVPVDVRVLAATNADLDAMVRAGTFRQDLLGRLRVAEITLPPLRERAGDLDALARGHLRAHRPDLDGPEWCTSEVRRLLESYAWPGNVRELENVLSVACVFADEGPIDLSHLGAWRGARAARAPILTTHSGAELPERPESFPVGLWRRATLGACRLPPLRERPQHALDALVAHALRGRPCSRRVWRALREHPWWGNLDELEQVADALAARPPGLLDLAGLERVAPDVARASSASPFTLMLAPTPKGDTLTGLTWAVESSGALIGRLRSLDALRQSVRAGDQRALETLSRIDAHASSSSLTCMGLGFLPRLSRVSALVTRGPEGLRVVAFEGLKLNARARSLDSASWAPLGDEPVELGRAGVIRFESARSGALYVQIYAFEDDAVADYADAILAEHDANARDEATLSILGGDDAPARQRLYLWRLSEPEREALSDLVDSFDGGSLSRHIARHLDALRGRPEVARLYDYLRAAPRASQYLSRLYTFEPNAPLRELLRARAAARVEGLLAWTESLPSGLRKILRA